MLTLTITIQEPHHRGLHLATVHPSDAEALRVAERLAAGDPVHIELTNGHAGPVAYARLISSSDVVPGTIGLQGYLADNCSVHPGEPVSVAVWDPVTRAQVAERLKLCDLTHVLEREDELLHVRQRLHDTALTVVPKHRFSLPVGDNEPVLEVVASTPDGVPVICGPDTKIEIVNMRLRDGSPPGADLTFADVGGLEEPIR